jgi:hypothetical protein
MNIPAKHSFHGPKYIFMGFLKKSEMEEIKQKIILHGIRGHTF